jgi:hypothetical protein
MNAKLFSVVGIFGLGLLAIGCGARNKGDANGDGALGESELQLQQDANEADDVEEATESALEESTSGAAPTEPGATPDAATDEELQEKVKTNIGLFFQPAGCITTTWSGNVATHVFTNCTGPYGMATFNGTVTSTYVREIGKLTITHEANGFTINAATVSGKRTVVYTRSGTVITRTRTGSWTGTTAKGNAISHEASFVTTYDTAARGITRDGSATTSVGGRSFSRSIEDYERCGIGSLGCPNSGKIVLTRTNATGSASLTIEFLGGNDYRVTRPNGTSVDRQLVCKEQ